MKVTEKDSGLKNAEACIQGQRFKDKYMTYQDNYREAFGVYPELDIKNQPFTALWDDPYICYKALMRKGFYSA